jgi:hypothetical protein
MPDSPGLFEKTPVEKELERTRAELNECYALFTRTQPEVNSCLSEKVARLRTELADARELLREAIPHLVGNGHWDGVDRIRAHLALAEAEKPTTIVKVSSPPR